MVAQGSLFLCWLRRMVEGHNSRILQWPSCTFMNAIGFAHPRDTNLQVRYLHSDAQCLGWVDQVEEYSSTFVCCEETYHCSGVVHSRRPCRSSSSDRLHVHEPECIDS